MPQIPNSGPISLSDFATEFGGTAPHSMSEYYRNGANVPSNNGNVPTAGAFRFGHMRGAINEIIVAATSAANVDISSLFGANWTSTVPKRLTIPAGVTIGGTGSSAALIIPANMAGTLEVDNAGSIIGFGGAANGGAGGHAINNAASNVTINNTGSLLAGGGGGGQGGIGGNGSYSQTVRQPSSGWYYSSITWHWALVGHAVRVRIHWNQGGYIQLGTNYQNSRTSWTTGGWTYLRGSQRSADYDSNYIWYAVARQRNQTSSTTGGSGGAGGVGQGYTQTNASGASGASGGTNAGTGGSGASGSAYGVAGSSGSTGANGNSTNGSAGSSGGAAGAAVTGTTVTMNNTGTLAGAVA